MIKLLMPTSAEAEHARGTKHLLAYIRDEGRALTAEDRAFIASMIERLDWVASGRKGGAPEPRGQRHRKPGPKRNNGGRIGDDRFTMHRLSLMLPHVRVNLSDREFVSTLARLTGIKADAVRKRLDRAGIPWKVADLSALDKSTG